MGDQNPGNGVDDREDVESAENRTEVADEPAPAEPLESNFSRRSYMSLVAAAGGTLAFGQAISQPAPETVVDLGEQGLSEGDAIDPYFEEHFQSGTEVRIPEGSYEWGGNGWGQVGNAALIGEGTVELHRPDEMNPRLEAQHGVVTVRNVTIRGEAGNNTSSIRLGAHDPDALLLVENFNLPDGSVDPSYSTGVYVPPAHSGVLVLRDCHVEGFADNGLYASAPGGHTDYTANDGAVVVDGGLYKNNNISNVRIGSSNSIVQNATIVHDGDAPSAANGADLRRGLRVRQAGQNLRVVNCDIVQRSPRWAVSIHSGAAGGSGVIEGTRIHHDGSDPAIRTQDGYDGEWVARNVHITGDGNLDSMIPLEDSCQGDGCRVPDDSPHETLEDGKELVFAGTETRNYEYTFTTTGRIAPRYEDSERPANPGSHDYAYENADGTWTAEGSVPTGSNYGDSFVFEGSVESVQISGDHDDVTVQLDGEEVSIEELIGDGSDDGTDDGSDNDGSGDDSSDDGSTDPDSETELVIVTEDPPELVEFEFVASGEITAQYDRDEYPADTEEPADEVWENDDGTWTALGYTADGATGGDAFLVTGDVLSFETTADAEILTLYADGTETTVDDLVVDDDSTGGDGSDGGDSDDGSDGSDTGDGSNDDSDDESDGDDSSDGSDGDDESELSNTIVIDGSDADEVTTYTFTVSGDVERAESTGSSPDDTAPSDRIEDLVTDGEVVGVVVLGVDTYNYSGTVESIDIRGDATVTFE